MNKIIHRIIKYQKIGRQSFDLHKVKEPEVVPVGHLYVVRNAGNFVPPYNPNAIEISSEAGAIELAVKRAGIKDIIISGHSDCRAMEYLSNVNKPNSEECKSSGPLTQWVKKFGHKSWNKFQAYLKNPKQPLKFQLKPPPTPPDLAYFDDKFLHLDILSQINCLQQSENVATFPFLRTQLLDNSVKVHTLWKELTSIGEDPTLFLFDIHKAKFLKIIEEYSDELTKDLD